MIESSTLQGRFAGAGNSSWEISNPRRVALGYAFASSVKKRPVPVPMSATMAEEDKLVAIDGWRR